MTEFSYKDGFYYWKPNSNIQYFQTDFKWYFRKNNSSKFYQLKNSSLVERLNNFSRKLKLEKLLS